MKISNYPFIQHYPLHPHRSENHTVQTHDDTYPQIIRRSLRVCLRLGEFMITEEERSVANTKRSKRLRTFKFIFRQAARDDPESIVEKVNEGKEDCVICKAENEGTGEVRDCGHTFCAGCLTQWSITSPTCPICRQTMSSWLLHPKKGTKVNGKKLKRIKKISIENVGLNIQSDRTMEVLIDPSHSRYHRDGSELLSDFVDVQDCKVCNHSGDQELLLLCDHCDGGTHTECLGIGTFVPGGMWFCDDCWNDDCCLKMAEKIPQQTRLSWIDARLSERAELMQLRGHPLEGYRITPPQPKKRRLTRSRTRTRRKNGRPASRLTLVNKKTKLAARRSSYSKRRK